MKEFTFLGVTINPFCSFKLYLDDLHSKATMVIFALNSRYKFHTLLVNVVLRRFDSLMLPILLCGSQVCNQYKFSTWVKSEV